MINRDLAKKEYWDNHYADCKQNLLEKWVPTDYNSQVIEHILMKEIARSNPKSILEIGCGNSTWLPYLAKMTGAQVAGIDYSEEGCSLVQNRLNIEKIEGKIFCEDFFKADPQSIGQYDFVYSLGVVEHFSDLKQTLKTELKFVKPGGTLFTEIPNLKSSVHRILAWVYQPELLSKHEKISKIDLIKVYNDLGLNHVEANFAGIFSLNIVAWGIYPRWKKLSKIFLPLLLLSARIVDNVLLKTKCYRGFAPISPFIYIKGEKQSEL